MEYKGIKKLKRQILWEKVWGYGGLAIVIAIIIGGFIDPNGITSGGWLRYVIVAIVILLLSIRSLRKANQLNKQVNK